ncbi:ATP-binding protein [Streptomyces sp. DSM 40750]|uniref:ATP-binding protein n=1 Tax=Streptomyces sp. DSM 40750 TaxID=2801030 RepID=UPI00214CF4BD|nr:ATP-binding protein [Streptomyces sp. DSM 40750]UUU24644.1 ATP-binding protein [Streptomyces sp. DSM 40750]
MSGVSRRGGGRMATRLGAAFALLIALLLVVGAGALTSALVADGMHRRVVTRLEPAADDNDRLHDEVVQMQRSVRSYLLTGDPAQLRAYREARDSSFAVLADVRRRADAEARESLATQAAELRAYAGVADQEAQAVPRSEQAARLTREAVQRFTAFETTNERLHSELTDEIKRQEDRAQTVLDGGIAVTAALLTAAVALSVFMAVRTTRALTGPLRNTERTLGRLTAGEHTARAEENGPQEIRAVARSVNLLADERDRLRALEEERQRLSRIARKTGIRIRENLGVDHVLDTACTGIGEGLDADYAFIMLTEEGSPLVPVVRAWSERRGLLPPAELTIPPVPADVVSEHYRRGTTWYLNDLVPHLADGSPLPEAPGSFGETGLPADARAAAKALGLVSVIAAAMGVGEQPLGAVFLARTRQDRPWRPVEIEIAESMASGVGRALHTSLLYEQEKRLVDKLRALDKAKSDFLSTVSHELRTPLTSIVGYLELLKDEDTGPLSLPQRHMLDIVDRNANRLRALIEDLLTLSRIESGAFTSRKAPIDLRHLVNSAADTISPAAEAASVSLETSCPEQPLILEADGEQLDRVLMNLLSNAVKFTPGGGKVSVRVDADDGEAVLSVSDTGIGIPAEEQEKLFQRFFRASNATDAAIPGTGLGLTIVHTIVANHGGRTEVRSEEGRGTTITARLPLAGTDTVTRAA